MKGAAEKLEKILEKVADTCVNQTR